MEGLVLLNHAREFFVQLNGIVADILLRFQNRFAVESFEVHEPRFLLQKLV